MKVKVKVELGRVGTSGLANNSVCVMCVCVCAGVSETEREGRACVVFFVREREGQKAEENDLRVCLFALS